MAIDEEKIKDIIVDKIGCKKEEVVPEASFQDLGLDSLDAVELIMLVEEEYNIQISDSEAENLKVVGDLISIIKEKSAN